METRDNAPLFYPVCLGGDPGTDGGGYTPFGEVTMADGGSGQAGWPAHRR